MYRARCANDTITLSVTVIAYFAADVEALLQQLRAPKFRLRAIRFVRTVRNFEVRAISQPKSVPAAQERLSSSATYPLHLSTGQKLEIGYVTAIIGASHQQVYACTALFPLVLLHLYRLVFERVHHSECDCYRTTANYPILC